MSLWMTTRAIFIALVTVISFSFAQAKDLKSSTPAWIITNSSDNILDELDPADPNIEQKLKELDKAYEEATGLPSHINENTTTTPDLGILENVLNSGCYRLSCTVYIVIDKSQQKAFLYLNGHPEGEYLTSTGVEGRSTPDFDTHPDGRIYDRYTSTKFPGGDYQGLGNMPYAVFIRGGYAIHGTGKSNWKKLGTRASHGCIRLHPDNAFKFNRLVRQYGVQDVWVTVN